MKVPDIIYLFGKPFTVECRKDHEYKEKTKGTIYHNRQKICYSDDHVTDDLRDTILHECIHGIGDACDLELTERQTGVLATMLISVSRENPELFRDIFTGKD